MAKKSTPAPSPNPFSAITESWKSISSMQPEIEKFFRWFNVPATATWPKWLSGGLAVLFGIVAFLYRIFIGIIRMCASILKGSIGLMSKK